jgi:dihydrofolate reductase
LQTLLAHDLIDEFRLLVFPLVLGPGKRLFGGGAQPAALKLAATTASTTGVVMGVYDRAGAIRTGSFELKHPSDAEVTRRARMEREG